jgi:hypothetical protein
MQYKQTLARIFCLIVPVFSFAQTTYLPQGARENHFMERLEIRLRTDSVLNFSAIKPFSRRQYIPHIDALDTTSLSRSDQYNMQVLRMNNLEWISGTPDQYASRKPIAKHFYKTPANLYEVHTEDFFLAINPVFQYYVAKEKDNNEHLFLNTRGVTIRGRIANKIGFSAYVTDNQERDPSYVQQWVDEREAVPGQGFYKDFKKTGYDYFDARGTLTFGVTKYIDVAFGYDKNFIGNGYRSLFLSDFSNSTLFLKLNTRIWKFQYQNLFMELQNAERFGADVLIPKKYAAMHYLDFAATKWLNIGLFEGVVFGRTNHFEFGYLNPLIFYRSIEQQNGSYDNALAGLNIKANIPKRLQVYGQLLLDEFKLSEIKANKGWWANKYGFQLGLKAIDVMNIRNLDAQIEWNRVRPFTYSHRDSVANYTHYNQPMAHPLGANFTEFLGVLRYQPVPKWNFVLKAIQYTQGRDTGNSNWGSNIFLPNVSPYRNGDYGYSVGGGVKTTVGYASLLMSYEWKPNLFFELNAVYREQLATTVTPKFRTAIVYAGIRWNMHRREFDF